MKKEHSAVDWSRRPLPEPWLEYAALDVEVLVELRERAGRPAGRGRQGRVGAAGVRAPALLRGRPARRRVAAYVGHAPGPRPPRPRRGAGRCGRPATSWPSAATSRPGRIIPDSAIVAAAQAMPTDRDALLGGQGVPRPRRRALLLALGRRAPRGRRARGVRAADPRPALRRATAPPRLGRPRPGRRPPAQPGPRGARPSWPSSRGCRSRTCSPPTTCAGCSGPRPPPATRSPWPRPSAAVALRARRPGLADRPGRPGRHPARSSTADQPRADGRARRPRRSRPRPRRAERRRLAVAGVVVARVDSDSSGGASTVCEASSICWVSSVEVGDLDLEQLLERHRRRRPRASAKLLDQRRDPHVLDAVVGHRRRGRAPGPAGGRRRRAPTLVLAGAR